MEGGNFGSKNAFRQVFLNRMNKQAGFAALRGTANKYDRRNFPRGLRYQQGCKLFSRKKTGSHGVAAGPLARSIVVTLAVGLVNVGDLGHKRIIGVRVGQQRANGEQDLRDSESG